MVQIYFHKFFAILYIYKYVLEGPHLKDFYSNKIYCRSSFFNNDRKGYNQASVHENITSIHMKSKHHNLDVNSVFKVGTK